MPRIGLDFSLTSSYLDNQILGKITDNDFLQINNITILIDDIAILISAPIIDSSLKINAMLILIDDLKIIIT